MGTPVPPDDTGLPPEAPVPLRGVAVAYLFATLATVFLLAVGQQLYDADFHAPFSYEYDGLLILPFVKATV